jgi:hypothetical protein
MATQDFWGFAYILRGERVRGERNWGRGKKRPVRVMWDSQQQVLMVCSNRLTQSPGLTGGIQLSRGLRGESRRSSRTYWNSTGSQRTDPCQGRKPMKDVDADCVC